MRKKIITINYFNKKKISILISLIVFLILPSISLLNFQVGQSNIFSGQPLTDELPNSSQPPPIRLRVGTTSGPQFLDPHYAWDFASIDFIDQVVETLFAYDFSDPEIPIIPRLAEEGHFDLVDDTYQFVVTLKTGRTFHDGHPFNAEAVEWNFNRLFYFMDPDDPEVPVTQFLELYCWEDGSPIIESVEATSKYEVTFVLTGPYAPFKALLTFPGSGMLSPNPFSTPEHQYIDTLTGDLVGTGPFVYDEYIEGSEVRFHAFENYLPYRARIDELVFKIYPNAYWTTQALLNGEVDYIDVLDLSRLDELNYNPEITLINAGTSTITRFLGMNNNPDSGINIKMREAISYALNYDQIIQEIVNGEAERLRSPVPQGILYANEYNVPYFDPDHARELLLTDTEYGYGAICLGKGLTSGSSPEDWEFIAQVDPIEEVTYIYTGSESQVRMFELLEQDLAQIGVKVHGWQPENFWDVLTNQGDSWDLYFLGWGADYNDPSNYINPQFADGGTSNYGQVHISDDFQEDIQTALLELDPGAREGLYDIIQQQVVDEYPWCWLYTAINYDAHSNEFTGFQPNSLERLYFYYVTPSDTTPPTIIHDTIPNDIKITYTRTPQIIGNIKAYDFSNIFYVGLYPNENPNPGFSLMTTFNEGEFGGQTMYFSESVVMTTNLLTRGLHIVPLIIVDDKMNTYVKTFIARVYRLASLKLSGEFDYLEKEKVKMSIAAQVYDREENFLLAPQGDTDFTVHIRILDYDGVVKVSDELMDYDSNGFFHWDSIFTINDLKDIFPKGIYIVQGWVEFSETSFYEEGNNVIQFHIDPPGENEPNTWLFLEIFSFGGLIMLTFALTFLYLRERRRRIE